MNKVVLMGRLTRDPEMRFTQGNNTAVCSFSLAVNRRFKQEGQPEADFINVVAWAKTAEFVGKYFTKGQQVGVIGRIQTRNYDDKDGKKVFVTEVVAEEAYFAESKKEQNTTSEPNVASEPNVTTSAGFMAVEGDSDLPF